MPGFPPPFILALVALDEDDRVRLTTNIVNVGLDDAFVGQRVQVRFEQQEDVFFPVFEPTGETDAAGAAVEGPIPHEDPRVRQVRPMPKAGDKFEDKVAITGIGISQVGRRLMREPITLTVEAALAAIEDAGLTLDDIDGLATYPGGLSAAGGMSEGGVQALEEALRIRPSWHHSGMETPGQTGSVVAAMLAVAGGLCNHVLCFRTVTEATALAKARAAAPGTGSAAAAMYSSKRVDGDMAWRLVYGAGSAANWIGMMCNTHFKLYGTTRETLGWIALTARKHAARNPLAIYTDPLTMDDYLSARMISTPFGLYDCDVPMDGAVAVIVSRKDIANDLRQPPVLVEAVGTQVTERISWDQGVVDHEPLVIGAARHLWTRTDLTPDDMQFAQLYDGFSFNCLTWLESLGFCGTGEAKDFLAGGQNISLGGKLPLNTHGGQLSAGRLHGYGFLHEAVLQLRGQAEGRQVENAEVGVVSNGGGTPGGAMILKAAR
jgi:acetyl-CoA acetyltransferase